MQWSIDFVPSGNFDHFTVYIISYVFLLSGILCCDGGYNGFMVQGTWLWVLASDFDSDSLP
jgi:hypothetical protein